MNQPKNQSVSLSGSNGVQIGNRDSMGSYLLRRVPPALGDPRVLLHSLVSDQLLALTLQLLNLTGKTNQEKNI